MKNILVTTMICLALGAFALTSCGGGGNQEQQTNEQQAPAGQTQHSANQGPEYTSAYVCPMHCEGSGSDKAGACPVCGMDYVALNEHTTDGHSHDDGSHEGHSH
jgi:predicted small lipoprotein YifL